MKGVTHRHGHGAGEETREEATEQRESDEAQGRRAAGAARRGPGAPGGPPATGREREHATTLTSDIQASDGWTGRRGRPRGERDPDTGAPTHNGAMPVPASLLDLADEWSARFKLLADPTRLRLLVALHYRGPGEATVSELAQATGVRVTTASSALQRLALAGVVRATRDGRAVRYRLVDERVHGLVHHLGGTHQTDGAPRR